MKVLSSDIVTDSPLFTTLSPLTDYTRRGHTLCLPIPCAKNLKITYENDNVYDTDITANKHLWWQESEAGDKLHLQFKSKERGIYRLLAQIEQGESTIEIKMLEYSRIILKHFLVSITMNLKSSRVEYSRSKYSETLKND